MAEQFDAFLSYNSGDRAAVEVVARELAARKVAVFLDKWHLKPGASWIEALEGALNSCRAMVIFLGPGGAGPWQNRERNFGLDRQTTDPDFSVVPVLLPGAESPEGFLSLFTFIDLRSGIDNADALTQLVSAIKGVPPSAPQIETENPPKIFLCHAKEDDDHTAKVYFFLRDVTTQVGPGPRCDWPY